MNAKGAAMLDRAARHRLTRRQLEIAVLLASGKMEKQIAGELGIKLRTVQKHVTDFRMKMGTPNTLSAVVLLLT
jgi:DNA-binding NarL/FixJ family response regulator